MGRNKVLLIISLLFLVLSGCSGKAATGENSSANVNITADKKKNTDTPLQWAELNFDHSMELLYAEQFQVDYYEGGFALISIEESGRFLVVPEDKVVPEGLDEDIVVLQKPLHSIYLVATSAMDLFCALDSVDNITLSGTDISGWYIEEARKAMEEGKMCYAGKYSAPDYERILSKECDLAVESTMIYHTPEVKEKLEKLGIPVLVERSSYESHPLGRMEWIKLYSVLLGKERQAEEYFRTKMEQVSDIMQQESTGKTVAFFFIQSNGSVNVRKSKDYVAKMITLAGGEYIFSHLNEEENALSTMNIQMETFFAEVRDADYLIYNSTIDGELETIEELLEKSGLLRDFKAVQQGNVWCTERNMFQESTGLSDMIVDIHRMITEEEPEGLRYLYRLQRE